MVENGKEYPLIPLSQRKSLFENKEQPKLSYKLAVTKLETPDVVKIIHKPKKEEISLKDPPVKSSNVPYIQEEQEILQNINLVSKIKPKFGNMQ